MGSYLAPYRSPELAEIRLENDGRAEELLGAGPRVAPVCGTNGKTAVMLNVESHQPELGDGESATPVMARHGGKDTTPHGQQKLIPVSPSHGGARAAQVALLALIVPKHQAARDVSR